MKFFQNFLKLIGTFQNYSKIPFTKFLLKCFRDSHEILLKFIQNFSISFNFTYNLGDLINWSFYIPTFKISKLFSHIVWNWYHHFRLSESIESIGAWVSIPSMLGYRYYQYLGSDYTAETLVSIILIQKKVSLILIPNNSLFDYRINLHCPKKWHVVWKYGV